LEDRAGLAYGVCPPCVDQRPFDRRVDVFEVFARRVQLLRLRGSSLNAAFALSPNFSKFKEAVEAATGRAVIAFMSQVTFDPDMAAEVFVLEPEAEDRAPES
jgi:hypothetical protein